MDVIGNVTNPSIPYVEKIPGGNLDVGKEISIKGRVSYNSEGFGVNLACGREIGNPRSDTPFHFNPRFNKNCVVMNSLRSNVWGKEERLGMPFLKEMEFELKICCQHYDYKVIINGSHFCDFKHRLPLADVNTITIEGDVVIKEVQYSVPQPVPPPYQPPHMGYSVVPPAKNMGYPASPSASMNMPLYNPPPYQPPHMGYSVVPPATNMSYPASPSAPMNMPVYNPATPLTTGIPNGLHHGKMIFISATPTAASGFTINIQEGQLHNADVGLQFDVRFNFGSSVNTVVRNHRTVGQWGQEERDVQYFPFIPNNPFEMIILCENTGFKVAVNNQHFIEFRHRLMPFAKSNMLNISGDVSIAQVRFQ